MKGPNFDATREVADRMLEETLAIAERCEGAYQALPVQLIHGDLHYDNVFVWTMSKGYEEGDPSPTSSPTQPVSLLLFCHWQFALEIKSVFH